jgi:hypothetical protein
MVAAAAFRGGRPYYLPESKGGTIHQYLKGGGAK